VGLVETEGIVLRTYNLAEADKIMVCLTRQAGVVRAVARGARRLKSRFGAGLEPFTIIDLAYYEKEGRELVSLRGVEIKRSFFNLSASAENVAVLAYMSELVMEFAPPQEPNERLYRMVKAVVETLGDAPEHLTALVRYFEIWTLKLGGFLPDLRNCAECAKGLGAEPRSYLNAEFRARCGQCSNRLGKEFSRAAHSHLRLAQRLSPYDFAQAARDLPGTTAITELADLSQGLIGRVLERQPRSRAALG
jgi:DNA repair protein RecO (recombination protein O)